MHKDQDYQGDMSELEYVHLPKIGYMAFLDKHPLAAGFLRKVEGGLVAQIDNLVSNPQFGSIIRNKALNIVVDQLKLEAKSLKLKGIYAFTLDTSVILRAVETGFQHTGHTILALRLTKE